MGYLLENCTFCELTQEVISRAMLTESNYQVARNYWKVLKSRITKEQKQPVTICNQLKLPTEDNKMRLTDVASTKQIFRIIQSIPSPKAEPFKQWMAQVALNKSSSLSINFILKTAQNAIFVLFFC